MKNLELSVNIEFSSWVADDDIPEILASVLAGIVRQVDEVGIAPQESGAHTKSVVVSTNVRNWKESKAWP